MLNIDYTLPNGEKAAALRISYPTVNVQTLGVVIAVGAYDAMGNLCETINVPYQLDAMRDIPVAEQEAIVSAYFEERAAP